MVKLGYLNVSTKIAGVLELFNSSLQQKVDLASIRDLAGPLEVVDFAVSDDTAPMQEDAE